MASNFAFSPMGLSRAVTVGGAAPATISLSLQSVGQTGTVALTAGNYIPSGIRIVNEGTANAFIQFGEAASSISVSPTIGMKMLSNSIETFSLRNRPFLAAVCASTFTVTLSVTLGEGL
jgi:hypothetical protein